MKKKTDKKQASELPNIYRFITERVIEATKNKAVIVSVYSIIYFILIGTIVFLTISFYRNLNTYQNVSSERLAIINKIKNWQGIIKKYPDFKDAYLQTAVLEYRLGNYEVAKSYCDKALLLDPEYSDAIELNKRLGE
jgi:tetratricopeptide (TPR) repeat protein